MKTVFNRPIDLAAITVATTPTKLITTASAGLDQYGVRTGLMIQPTAPIYIGGKAVTKDTGIKLATDQICMLENNAGTDWYGICEAGTVTTRVVPIVS